MLSSAKENCRRFSPQAALPFYTALARLSVSWGIAVSDVYFWKWRVINARYCCDFLKIIDQTVLIASDIFRCKWATGCRMQPFLAFTSKYEYLRHNGHAVTQIFVFIILPHMEQRTIIVYYYHRRSVYAFKYVEELFWCCILWLKSNAAWKPEKSIRIYCT